MVAFDKRAYVISDRELTRRLIFGRNRMQKIDKFAHAANVVALCLPPVVMSLIGLAALSRNKGDAVVVAGKKPTPTQRPVRRSRTGCSTRIAAR